jgi:hypothetical protein
MRFIPLINLSIFFDIKFLLILPLTVSYFSFILPYIFCHVIFNFLSLSVFFQSIHLLIVRKISCQFLFPSILRIFISPPLCATFSLAHHSLPFHIATSFLFAVFLSYFLPYYISSFYSRCLSLCVLAQRCSVLVCSVPYMTK